MSEFNLNDNENEIQNNEEAVSEKKDDLLPDEKKSDKRILREITDYIEVFAFAIAITVILLSLCFNLCFVEGDSMNNTLIEGETLILSDLFYKPKQGDIVVFYNEARQKPLVKRVIATENETVNILYFDSTMIVEITGTDGNKRVLEENYILYDNGFRPYSDRKYVVPEGCVFVLGDNRNNSADSRDPSVGFVDERTILGKMIFKANIPFLPLGKNK